MLDAIFSVAGVLPGATGSQTSIVSGKQAMSVIITLTLHKWIASDIPRGLATGSASEYKEKNIPCIEIPCGLAGGSLQFLKGSEEKGLLMTTGFNILRP